MCQEMQEFCTRSAFQVDKSTSSGGQTWQGALGITHWTPAWESQLTRGRGQGHAPYGSESLRAVGEETDVLRQSHKSVFVAKLEKYVRKQIAAKRRRRSRRRLHSWNLRHATVRTWTRRDRVVAGDRPIAGVTVIVIFGAVAGAMAIAVAITGAEARQRRWGTHANARGTDSKGHICCTLQDFRLGWSEKMWDKKNSSNVDASG